MPIRFLLFITATCHFTTVTATETILTYDSEITIHQDASLLVVETITIKAEGIKIKRGIYRDFPTDYKDRSGHRYQIGFKVISILRDGNPEPFHLKKQSNGVGIFIGNKDRYLEPGTYTFTIHYETNRQLGFFTDHDEFYWNVTGNEWGFPIKKTTATVYLPQLIPDNSITLKAYTGKTDQQGTNYVAYLQNNHSAYFESTQPFNPGQGLTIVVTWPKNFVTEPDTTTNLHYFFDDNPESLIAVAGFIIILTYALFVWFLVGKAPEKDSIIPLYQAPTGFSPASMRFIKRMKYDHKTFAAAIINLAIKGHLHIEEGTSGKFVLNKKHSTAALAPGEKTLLNHLFASNNPFIELKRTNHEQIKKALDAHKKSLLLDLEKIYFLNNSTYLIPSIVLSMVMLALMIFTVPEGDKTSITFFLVWLSIWTIGVFLLILTAFKAWKNIFIRRSFIHLIFCIFITLFALPFVIGELFGLKMLSTEVSSTIAVSLPLLVFLNFYFYNCLKTSPLSERKLLDKLDGFKLYLEVAEKDDTMNIQPTGNTVDLFEQLLPYALALDVERQWSEKFSSTLQQTGMGSEYQPRWYNASHRHHDHFNSFASTIGNNITSSVASSSTAPFLR